MGLASLPAEAPAPSSTTVAPAPVATLPVSPPPRAAAVAPPASTSTSSTTVVVAPGDSLWELAARQLAVATGRARVDVGDADVGPYWVAVCDENRATLASGDPGLIFPGEVVTLPPVR